LESDERITMKKLLLCFALASSPALAEWQQVGENADGQIYIDPSRIYENAGWKRAWVLVNRLKKDENGALSYMTFSDYDCKSRDMLIAEFITYSKPNGQGKALKNARHPVRGWFAMPPNSLGEAAFDKICATATDQ